jgi:adenosine deaminase
MQGPYNICTRLLPTLLHIFLAAQSTMGIEEALPVREREKLRDELLATNDSFVLQVPKVELHVHLEGTLTAELRWKLTRRNGATLRIADHGPELKSLEETRAAMDLLRPDPSRVNNDEERFQFFEAYYEGFESVKTQEDFFDLVMHYVENAARMNVRHCELFFDPQGHTSRGTSWETMMGGFRQAKEKAEELGVRCPDTNLLLLISPRCRSRISCAFFETCRQNQR